MAPRAPIVLGAGAGIVTGFANGVNPGAPAFQATPCIAICLLALHVVLHAVVGPAVGKHFMWVLAGPTAAPVIAVLSEGEGA